MRRLGNYYEPMTDYQNNVKSGDITNMEGIAAQHYWKYLIGNGFYGKRFGDSLISFNFGYSVLCSMVARAIVETGLLPVMGLFFHKNKYNPYCLADDLMEPYRPVCGYIGDAMAPNQSGSRRTD